MTKLNWTEYSLSFCPATIFMRCVHDKSLLDAVVSRKSTVIPTPEPRQTFDDVESEFKFSARTRNVLNDYQRS